MHHIFYRALLAIFISLHAVASEGELESLEEHRLPIYQAEHYQEIELHPHIHKKINIFIGSNPGQPIPQTSEIPFYDNNAPQFIKHSCEDGVYEFLQKGRETGGLKKAENDEFDYGRMDEIKEVLKIPYKFFGNLLITFPHSEESKNRPGRCIGSGLLMGPNQVLTAGHNLYDHKRGGWAQEIIFTPAQQGEQKPFGEARATVLKAFKGWIENKAENHDMGVLILDRPIGYQAGWAGLAIIDDTYYLTQKPSITIAGYPSTDVRLLTQEGEPRISHALMREHQGDVLKAEASRLYYKVNTRGGQSGGPIVAYLKELKGYFVLGIHTHGYDEANEGTRLTATKFWPIHECRQMFNMPEGFMVVGVSKVTMGASGTSSHKFCKRQYEIASSENKEEKALYASAQKKKRTAYEQATGREDNQEERINSKELTFPQAPFDQGYIYFNGQSFEVDEAQLLESYRKAAAQGDNHAQCELGFRYDNGLGVKKDKTLAAEWYHKAAIQGNVEAQSKLGMKYATGRGVPRNDKLAFKWRSKAVKAGDVDAQYNLGVMYERGKGVKKDEAQAAEWYHKAALKGNTSAQYNLGIMLATGRGVPRNDKLAFEWISKAAKAGDVDAQYNLGVMYEIGRGTLMNRRKAVKWYKKAEAQGDKQALDKLNKLESIKSRAKLLE